MTKKSLTRDEFAKKIADVMVMPSEPENPDPQDNGYNWGLAHAELLFAGVEVETIKEMQGRLRTR
jgi:hypothetical protein